jgi:hypothetical protein
MRKTLSAAVLVLALSGLAIAGNIPNPLGPQPAGVTAAGDIPTPSATDGDTQDGVTASLLSVVGSLLGLF